jgi:Flp pilus assembly protein TadG
MLVNLARAFARMRGARSGAAAVEFVFIAPVVIVVFFGLIELSEGVNCKERMENMASTAADLVAQTTTLTNNGRDNVFGAANAIMFPYPGTAKIKLTSLIVDPNNANNGKVVWSDATANTQAHAVNEIIPNLPQGVITAGGSVILAEVSYTHFSPVGIFRVSNGDLERRNDTGVTMSTKFYARPRRSVNVSRIP